MKNVPITLDSKTAAWARVYAVRRNVSLSRFVGELLRERTRESREIEQRYRLSWWDSTVVGAAQLQNCALLLTEDLQNGAVFGGVTVRSPFTLAVEESRAMYSLPSTAQRHRPRGRPRREGRGT